ncbi:MAG: 30S ribosome-binding factor RbfA [Candidatus Aminicenantes bacterium]
MNNNKSRRQKKVQSLLQDVLSRTLLESSIGGPSTMISITGIEMTRDLRIAYIYLSVFGTTDEKGVVEDLNQKKGYFRKAIASQTKLKYNPMLIFNLDPRFEQKERIEKILKDIKNNER